MHHLTSSLSAYACHVTRTWSRDTHSTWRNRVFNRSFRRKDEYLSLYTHFLTGKKKSSNSSVQTTGGCCSCEETPSVVASDHPLLILEPSPEASPLVGLLGYRFQSCSCEAVKEPPFSGYQWSALFWYWNLHQRPFHWCDCWGYRFQSCSDHRCGCSEGSPTRSRGDHWDPYLPCAEFWTGTGPVQATGRVTSQPVMRDTSTSSVQTAGCGHRNPARATG